MQNGYNSDGTCPTETLYNSPHVKKYISVVSLVISNAILWREESTLAINQGNVLKRI